MLRRKIFLGNSLLLLGLIGISVSMLIFFTIRENRLEAQKQHLVSSSVLIGDLERFIHWDDRVAISQMIGRQMDIHRCLEYVFVTLNGKPYVDSFAGDIPGELVQLPYGVKDAPYVWEYFDQAGEIFYDFVVPIANTNAVLRTGIKRKNIDQQVYPVIYTIAGSGLVIILIGLLFSSRIAVWATKEIALLSDAIKFYGDDSSNKTVPQKMVEVVDLAESFRSNVAERKKAEEKLRQLQNELTNIINSMPSILIAVKENGEVSQWNKTAEKATNLAAAEAKDKQISDVFPRLAAEMEKIVHSIQSQEVIKELKKPRQHANHVHYEDITIYPLDVEDTQGAVIRIDDVTEKVKLEEQLAHSRKMDAIGQLAGGVAHDFNNMLGVIIGAANLLKAAKRNLDPKGLEHVGVILQSANRAADLTAQLLAFARKSKVQFKTVDIHKVTQEMLTIINRTIDKKIKIAVRLEADSHTLIGEDSQLQSALLNLCINASHAMPDGGEITVSTKNTVLTESFCKANPFAIAPGNYIEIEIRDTGCGIPLEDQQRIFEPFFTTKAHGKGTGLGLAAVYATVLAHHGAIKVYSEEGEGTAFHMFLPCSDEEAVPKTSEKEVVAGSGLILLVDDEEMVRIVGKDMLEEMGYQVLLAENGNDAVKIFLDRHKEIDLVILDMIMPEMNGRDAFLQMHKIDPACKVLLTSGFLKDDSLNELYSLGLKGFVHKPYQNNELSRVVAKILHSRN